MKRTTAGINFFRVHSNPEANSENSSSSRTRPAKSILQEISDDNEKFRQSEDIEIHEKLLEIEVQKELVPSRKDTNLVFADIPGINEANVGNK